MRFYLQSANPQDFSKFSQFLPLSGVIITPDLIVPEHPAFTESNLTDTGTLNLVKEFLEVLPENCELILPVMEQGFRRMLAEAQDFIKISKQIIPALTASTQGYMALKACRTLKIPAAARSIAFCEQAEFARLNQARYCLISMKEAALCESSGRFMEQLVRTSTSLDDVIVYNLQNLSQLRDCLCAKAGACALKPELLIQALDHPVCMADIGQEKENWIAMFTRSSFFEAE